MSKWSRKKAAVEICEWVYSDTLVKLSPAVIARLIHKDGIIPSKHECEILVLGSECQEGSMVPKSTKRRFANIDRYLDEELT